MNTYYLSGRLGTYKDVAVQKNTKSKNVTGTTKMITESSVLIGVKAGGAAVGSSIAVVFKPGGDPWHRLLSRFIIGTCMGFIFSPLLSDFMGWPNTMNYWLASSCAIGMFSVLLLQILFSEETRRAIIDKVSQ